MGRIKNYILDTQRDLEEDLSNLRQQLVDKESEMLNFELKQHLEVIWENVNELKRRLDALEGKTRGGAAKKGSKDTLSKLCALVAFLGFIGYYFRKK